MHRSNEAAHAFDPRRVLLRMAAVGMSTGAVCLAIAVVGAVAFTPTSRNDAAATSSMTHGVVFLVSMALLGLTAVAAGAVAMTARARFPDVARLTDVNDALPFAAAVLTFLSVVALIVLGAGAYAAVVIVAMVFVVVTTSGTGKVLAAERGRERPLSL